MAWPRTDEEYRRLLEMGLDPDNLAQIERGDYQEQDPFQTTVDPPAGSGLGGDPGSLYSAMGIGGPGTGDPEIGGGGGLGPDGAPQRGGVEDDREGTERDDETFGGGDVTTGGGDGGAGGTGGGGIPGSSGETGTTVGTGGGTGGREGGTSDGGAGGTGGSGQPTTEDIRAQIPDFDWGGASQGDAPPGQQTVVPPPPPPPSAPPPPGDFGAAAQIPGQTATPQYQPPSGPGEAPDFLSILDQYGIDQDGIGNVEMPGDAPNFRGIAEGVAGYETPEEAFLGENIYGRLEQHALDWLDNPNRYQGELAQQTRAEMDERLAENERQRERQIEEWAASHGLTASSLQGGLMAELAGEMRRAQSAEEVELLQRIADAEIADRQAAGMYGETVGEFGRRLGETRIGEAQGAADQALRRGQLELDAATRADEAERARTQLGIDLENAAVNQGAVMAGLAMDAAQMQEQAERYRADFDRQVAEFGWEAAHRNAQLEQQRHMRQAELNLQAAIQGDQAAMRRAELELDTMRAMDAATMNRAQLEIQQDEIAQRAWQLQEDFRLRGEQINADIAQGMAELEFRYESMLRDDAFRWEELDERRRQHDDWVDLQS